MIGLAEWHIHTHTGDRTRTALRQVLAQLAPTVNGRLVVISADGDGPAVVTCYADPHGLDPRSTHRNLCGGPGDRRCMAAGVAR